MISHLQNSDLTVKLAETQGELHAAQRLRYEVFVRELGGGGAMVDHAAGLERDRFDAHADHLILQKRECGEVVGVYRLLRGCRAQNGEGFYSQSEYDLSPLTASGRRLLELGRSCLHREHRGGTAMHQLWQGVADYIARHRIEILFGVASFHGTDVAALAPQLSLLHRNHLAPPALRASARAPGRQRMDLLCPAQLDRRAAMIAMPSLIKAYLRLGGCVGQGAFVDHAFNTTDVCMILETRHLAGRPARLLRGAGR